MSRQATLADHVSSADEVIDLREGSALSLSRFIASMVGDVHADRIIGPRGKVLASVHDAALLAAVERPTDFVAVELRKTPKFPTPFAADSVLLQIHDAQNELRREIGSRDEPDGLKMSPDAIAFHAGNGGRYVIDFHEENFSNARGFHKFVAEDSSTFAQLALTAANFEGGQRWPGILCMHVACTIEHRGEPYLVLTQRFRASGDGGYHAGAWSASIEEQMELQDVDADSGFRRAVSEELLGDMHTNAVYPRTMGMFLEQSILNTNILGHVELPTTFDELLSAWRSAPDFAENCQLIAMPLRHDLVMQCIENHALTEAVREVCLVEDPTSKLWARNVEWDLHPTSALRMLTSLWVAQASA